MRTCSETFPPSNSLRKLQIGYKPFQARRVALILELHGLNMPQKDRQILRQQAGYLFRLRFQCRQEDLTRQQQRTLHRAEQAAELFLGIRCKAVIGGADIT